MKVLTTVAEVRQITEQARHAANTVGFVATMGALHAGHRSLIDAARTECDFVVVSIFVNPSQFGPSEDLASYPRSLDADLEMCTDASVDVVFVPSAQEMYRASLTTVRVSGLTDSMEATHRPGHFDGVATVVTKLFSIVGPCRAYFGRKDGQQLRVIEQLVEDLNLPVAVVGCPTVREPDGLALSSRNIYLTANQREIARAIPQVLFELAGNSSPTSSVDELRQRAISSLQDAGVDGVDYLRIVDPITLRDVDDLSGPATAFVAVRIGNTRLIDNIELQPVAAPNQRLAKTQGGGR